MKKPRSEGHWSDPRLGICWQRLVLNRLIFRKQPTQKPDGRHTVVEHFVMKLLPGKTQPLPVFDILRVVGACLMHNCQQFTRLDFAPPFFHRTGAPDFSVLVIVSVTLAAAQREASVENLSCF